VLFRQQKGFQENANFSPKMGKNSDHNIDPWGGKRFCERFGDTESRKLILTFFERKIISRKPFVGLCFKNFVR
jgi:hypothetical protein